jgi:dTDP-4-dehydrorhamnose 3,5-epimerase
MERLAPLVTGVPDQQTVEADGTPVASTIFGVRTRSTINHVDHRGSVYEIFEGDNDYWDAAVVYAYQFSIRAGQCKGWGLHEFKEDRYTLVHGEVVVLLFDARPDSPTSGLVQQVYLSDRALRQVTIPRFVWHLTVNLGSDEAQLINFPTEPYDHACPDRQLLPWDTAQIPVDVAALLPKF